MTYALGRGLEYYDMPAVRAIARDAADDDYRFSNIIMGIVESDAFQMRKPPRTFRRTPRSWQAHAEPTRGDDCDVHHETTPPPPHVPARNRSRHCSTAARRDGAGDGRNADGAEPLQLPARAARRIAGLLAADGHRQELGAVAHSQPIAPFKDHITVISGTDHRMATSLSPEESAGDHSRTAAVYLSAAHPKRTEGQDIHAGVTIDQVLANQIGRESPLPSLEMCIEDVGSLGVCGVGYSCAYTNSIAWSSPTSPLPMERNPQVVFERLFGDGGTPEERAARKREDRSILDSVLADMNRLKRGLGPSDLARFDDYLDDIREIERRIALAEHTAAVEADRPETAELPFDEHVKLMFDLQVLGVQGRHHARRDDDVLARPEREGLHRERRTGRVPRAVAPPERSGAHGTLREAERLPRESARLLPR